MQRRILRYLEDRVATASDPEKFGKALSGRLAGLWRYRVEDHRIVCQIVHDEVLVLVLSVGHRRDIYERLGNLP